MNLDFCRLHFPAVEGYSPRTLRQTIDGGFESGWATSGDGTRDQCVYTDSTNDRYSERERTEVAVDALVEEQDKSIKFFLDEGEFDFTFSVQEDWEEQGLPGLGGVTLVWHRTFFWQDPAETARVVYDVAAQVFEVLEPPFAFSYLPLDVERETPVSPADVEAGAPPDVYWLTLLQEDLVEQIGRECLASAPVWRSEELEGGGHGLVVTEDMHDYGPEEKRAVREHLGFGDWRGTR